RKNSNKAVLTWSGLLHCDHSDRDTCSPGTTITLTCSGRWKHLQQHSLNLKAWLCLFTLRCCFHPDPDPDDVRLVGGASRCAGRLEVKHDGVWRAVNILHSDWNMKVAAVIYSVRLMGGTHLCSGRLQVKWNQVWSSVCSDGFDLQDAEVVCRELGCGSPSVFEGELYGEAPEWSTEFLCGGHESGLLHCDHSDRDTCSPGTTITLTCSDHVRLVGNSSTCAGELQMKVQGEWRPVVDQDWDRNQNRTSAAAAVCSQLGCGSAVAINVEDFELDRPVWLIKSSCFQSAVSLLDCLVLDDVTEDFLSLQVICSGNDSFRCFL
uniref:SRCR domain-containing protein n=1 Tax=Amphiprion ocellaris TaxID=80972 RepID=A0A3Q1C7Z2_AMPOC